MLKYLILEIVFYTASTVCLFVLIINLSKSTNIYSFIKKRKFYIPTLLFFIFLVLGFISNKTYPPHFAMPAFLMSHAPGEMPASIPFNKIIEFFKYKDRFEKVADIGADPNKVPETPQMPDADGVVHISLVAQEVISEIATGIYFNYWTYNNQVPGPMLRVREGDTIELSLTNHSSSLHPHNIDLHAVTGPGGGAVLTNVNPGEKKTFKWKALNPGLYVYHCATPNVSTHNSHGQYGLIMVDPLDSNMALPKVDKEFYVMQGELYTSGQLGKKGLVPFDSEALLDGIPNYVTFNGKVEQTPRMKAKVGDTVRMYVGNGGVNLISSFHIIGEIFDTVYPNANIGGAKEYNTQATAILPGGAGIIEFKLDVPGKYILVDHALARMNKGAWAILEVSGDSNPEIFAPVGEDKNKNMIMH